MKETTHTPGTEVPRHWVWHSTEQSVTNGQISLLAIIETLLSVVLYFWLAQHFEWQWWWLLTALAAPILLLRSEESKRQGLRWFESYWNRGLNAEKLSLSRTEGRLIALTSILTSVTCIYWLSNFSDKSWLFKVDNKIQRLDILESKIWLLLLAIGIGGWLSVVLRTVYAGQISLVHTLENAERSTIWGTTPEAMLVIIGIWVRSLLIRITASLRHWQSGLLNLPSNWRQLLVEIDITREPELLPNLNQHYSELSLGELLTSGHKWLTYPMALAFYFPALLWRWSLKSTVWLWWPIVLLTRQPLANQSPELVRDHAAARVSGSGRFLTYGAGFITVWLLVNQWPPLADWLALLPEPYAKLSKDLLTQQAPPPLGIRSVLLGIASLFGLMTGWQAMCLKAMHKKVLEEETSFAELPKQRQDLFATRARHLERWHTATVVALIALGYAVVAWLAQHDYPEQISHYLHPWLLSHL